MKFIVYNFNDLSFGYKNIMWNKVNLKKWNNWNEKKKNYYRDFEIVVVYMFWK